VPAFYKEGAYRSSPFSDGSRAGIRIQNWWSFLSGGLAGVVFGDENVWRFKDGTWQAAISDGGASDMQRFGQLLQSIPWWLLTPSELSSLRRLIPSGAGTQSGTPSNYVAAACASDGSVLLAYVPNFSTGAQSFTVDTRSMKGNSRARWWDPTNGS